MADQERIPTLRDIRRRAAAIRRGWSKLIEERRRVGNGRQRWELPVVSSDLLTEETNEDRDGPRTSTT